MYKYLYISIYYTCIKYNKIIRNFIMRKRHDFTRRKKIALCIYNRKITVPVKKIQINVIDYI